MATNQGRLNFTVGFNIDQTGLNQLKTSLMSLQNLKTTDLVGIDSKKAETELEKIKASAKSVEAALTASFNPALNTYNIDVFKQKLAESGTGLATLRTQFSEAGAQGTIAFRNLTTAITSTKLPLQETHNLLKSMGTTLMNTIKWSIASNAINTVTSSVQKAWSYTRDLDESLNNIMIVTDKSADSMAQFARQANKASRELGKSTVDYTNASLIYYQQGLNDAEVQARTETTLKAANVTGQSTDTVSEQLTAVWNGYKVNAQEAELYIDKLSAVAATTAADLEELSTGMSKVASAANNMGVNVDQLNAQLATVISVTKQAPESVGTAFKTIFARISDIEAGIDTETTLGEYTKQMAAMGVNVLDANNHLRDQGEVIEEIGNKWETLSREQQISLAQTMAGTRQYNNLLALFENWGMYERAMQTSINASGTLQKQQEIYMESIEAHLEQLGNSGERVYQALLNPEGATDFISLLTGAVDLFANLLESIGGGGNLLMALVPVMTRLFSGSIASGVATFVTNMQNARSSATSLKSLLENIQDIKLDGDALVADYDKKIVNLRENLILLKQQGTITNQEFNELTDSINAFAKAASDYEVAQATYDPTTLGAKMHNLLQSGFANPSATEGHNPVSSQMAQEYINRVAETGANNPFTADQLKNITSVEYFDSSGENAYARLIKQLNVINENFETATKNANQLNIALGGKGGAFNSLEKLTKNSKQFEEDLKSSLNYAAEIKKSGFLKGEDLTTFNAALEVMDKEALPASQEEFKALQAAVYDFNRLTKKAMENGAVKTKDLEQKLRELAMGGANAARESMNQFGAATEAAFKRANLEKRINQFTKLASNTGMAVSAIQMLTNLGSIWSNEDISTGEKILQTITNLASVTGMLTPLILAATKAYNAQKDAIAASMVIEGTKLSLDNLVAIALGHQTGEISKNAAMTKLLELARRELTEEQLKAIGITDLETKEIDENTAAKLKNLLLDKQLKKVSFKDVIGDGWEKITTFFKTHSWAKWAAGAAIAIAIVAGATAIAVNAVNANEEKEKKALEAANERASALRERASEAAAAYSKVASSISALESAEESLDKLTEGTADWAKALHDANTEVLELLKKYPELYNYISTDENGLMTISDAGKELVKANALQEMQTAQSAALIAEQQATQAEIELQRREFAESMTVTNGFGTHGDQGLEAGITTGAVALGGAAIGAVALSWMPVLGPIIGAAVGAAVGGAVGAVDYAIDEANENAIIDKTRSAEMDAVVDAYQKGGEGIFDSNEALIKALSKATNDLSPFEKSLIDNKEETVKLVDSLAKYNQTLQATLIQIGAGYVDADATSGEKYYAGEIAKVEADKVLAEIQKSGISDEELAKEALKASGLSAANLLEAKDGKIKYTDKEGNEKTWSRAQIEGIVANERAKDTTQSLVNEMSKNLEAALTGFSDTQKELISQLGTAQGFSLQNATYADFQKLNLEGLTETQWAFLAAAMGKEVEDLKLEFYDAADKAARDWRAPANLSDTVLTKFNAAIDGIDLSTVALPTYEKFASNFEAIWEDFGEAGASTVSALLNAAGEDADELINKIGELDWTSSDIRQQFGKALSDLDIEVDFGIMSEFMSMMRNINGVFGETAESLQKLNASVLSIIGTLTKGDIISEEQYQELVTKWGVDAVQDVFIQLRDDTYMLIESQGKLINAWDQNVDTLTEDSISNYEKRIKELKGPNGILATIEKDLAYGDALSQERVNLNNYIEKLKAESDFGLTSNAYGTVLSLKSGLSFPDIFAVIRSYSSEITSEIEEIMSSYEQFQVYDDISYYGSKQTEDLAKLQEAYTKAFLATDPVLSRQEKIYNKSYEEYKAYMEKTYGAVDVTPEQFEAELKILKKEVAEVVATSMGQALTFEELDAVNKKYAELLEGQKDYEEAYVKNVERIGISTLKELEEYTNLPIAALDEYVARLRDEDQTLSEAYQEAFDQLVSSADEFNAAIQEATSNIELLESALEGLGGQAVIDNLIQQVDELERLNGLLQDKQTNRYGTEDTLGTEEELIYTQLEALVNEVNLGMSTDDLFAALINSDGSLNRASLEVFRDAFAKNKGLFADNAEVKDLWSKLLENLELYGTEYDEIAKNIRENDQKRLDLNLQIIESNLEFKQSELELKQVIDEFAHSFIDDDDFDTKIEARKGDLALTKLSIEANTQALEDLQEAYAAGDISQRAYLEKSEELLQANIDSAAELKSIYEEMVEIQLDAVSKVTELYDEQTEAREGLIETYENEIELQKILFGEDSLVNYTKLITQRTQMLTDAEAEASYWESLMKSELFDSYSKEYQETIIKNFQAANKEVIDLTFALIEDREKEFLETQKSLFLAFEAQFMPNATSLEGASREWEWMKEDDDKYLDDVEKQYGLQDLERQFAASSKAANGNLKYQTELNNLREEELANLQKKDKLTQYDLDRAAARLRILEAQMALEDAQENKTKMRLTRGADGTYGYQYVADMDAIVEKEEELAEANKALYDLDKEAYVKNLDEFYDAYVEFQNKIKEYSKDGLITAEERADLEAHADRIEAIAEGNNELLNAVGRVSSALEESGLQTMIENIYAVHNTENSGMTTFADLLDDIQSATTDYFTTISELTTHGNNANEKLADSYGVVIDKLDGEDGLIALMSQEVTSVSAAITNMPKLEEVYNNLGLSVDALRDKYLALARARRAAGELPDLSDNDSEGLGDLNIGQKPPEGETEDSGTGGGKSEQRNASVSMFAASAGISGEETISNNFKINANGEIVQNEHSAELQIGQAKMSFDLLPETTDPAVLKFVQEEQVKKPGQSLQNSVFMWTEGTQHTPYFIGKNNKVFPIAIETLDPAELVILQKFIESTQTSFQYATGGLADYTGPAWLDGTLSRPELVLNQDETEDFLKALDILRILNLSMLENVASLNNINSGRLQSEVLSSGIEQTVNINAEFPNATDKDEIIEAFRELSNLATQHAFKK